MRTTEFSDEQERRKQLLTAAAQGDAMAQKTLQQEYKVRILLPAERAQYKYVEIKPDRSCHPAIATETINQRLEFRSRR